MKRTIILASTLAAVWLALSLGCALLSTLTTPLESSETLGPNSTLGLDGHIQLTTSPIPALQLSEAPGLTATFRLDRHSQPAITASPATSLQQTETPGSSETPEVSATSSPSETLMPDSQIQPTFTPTPLSPVPTAFLQMLAPGPASKVTSPFLLRAVVVPGPNGVVRTELLGEDGRLLMRDLKVYTETRGVQVSMALEIEFGISAVAEAARLQISVEDEHDRTTALASVDLVLLSLGRSDPNPPGDLLEELSIQSPRPNALVQGGVLTVSGLARPRTDQPLVVEIIAPDGQVLGSRQVGVEGQQGARHGTFAIEVPYTVSEPTRVLVVVWERGERIPGVAQLSSVEVMVGP